MKAVCEVNGLPREEILPAFLALKLVGGDEHASIPHELLHFNPAEGIRLQLFDQTTDEYRKILQFLKDALNSNEYPTVQDIIECAKMLLEQRITAHRPGAIMATQSDLDLSKYQSLLHLAGCLYLQTEHQVLECTAQEIV